MTRKEADALYAGSWDLTVHSIEQAMDRIKALASLGAYEAIFRFITFEERDDVHLQLNNLGFDVDEYNGYDDMLQVNWG